MRLGGKDLYIHRLVLEAFIGPCPDGMQCNHIDHNPLNNRLENLEWVTPSENTLHSYASGRPRAMGERMGSAKLTEEQVIEMRQRFAEGEAYRQLAREYEVSKNTAWAAIKRQTWNHVP